MARSSAIVMTAFLVSKIVGLLRERAIAHQFGASAELDAYVAAFRIPDLLFTLVAGGALISAFLPVFAGALARGQEDEAWTLASATTNLIFLATGTLSLLAMLSAPWLVRTVLVPHFAPAQQALTVDLLRIVLVGTMIFAASGLQMGVLQAFQDFTPPAVAPILYNLGILLAAVALGPRFGIRALAMGVVLGAFMHLGIQLPFLRHHGYRYRFTLGLSAPGVLPVFWLMWPRMIALGAVQLMFFVNTRLASGLPAGSLAALNYAWVLAQMPQTILGTAIATVAFPRLAELAALGERDRLRQTATTALRVMIALTIPASVALWILAGPAIDVLLRTGRFDAAAALATSLTLRMFTLGLLGQVALEMVARLFYAQQNTRTPMFMAIGAMGLNILLAQLLVVHWQAAGLALANSLAVTLEVVAGIWLLRRMMGRLDGHALARTLSQSVAAGSLMAVACAGALRLLPPATALGTIHGPLVDGIVRLALGGLAGGLAYAAAAYALGMSEVRMVTERIARRRS